MTLAEELEAILQNHDPRFFGELSLVQKGDGEYLACHSEEFEAAGSLPNIESLAELREIAKFDSNSEYRPLKTAPTLRGGWKTVTGDVTEFLKRIDCIYPGVFATWIAYDRGAHNATPLHETLNRQTGMYRFAGSITDQMANQIMRDTCSAGCLRKIAWPISSDFPVSRLKPTMRSIPVICTEACSFAVSEAGRLASEAYDKENSPAANS